MIINPIISGGGSEQHLFTGAWSNCSITFANGTYNTGQNHRIVSDPVVGVIDIELLDMANYEYAVCAYRMTNTSNTVTYVGFWNGSQFTTSGSDYWLTISKLTIKDYYVDSSVNADRLIIRVVIRNKLDPSAAINTSEGGNCKITLYSTQS